MSKKFENLITLTQIQNGQDGQDGHTPQKGVDYFDGVTYYTWIKYADDANGTNMADDPSGRKYMGIAYNKTQIQESNNAADYSWSLIKGNDGTDGINGQDGKIYYNWIKYADDENGANMSSSPDDKFYIGIAYNKDSATPSDKPEDYVWSLFRGSDGATGPQGDQGPQGAPGKDGVDGKDANTVLVVTNTDKISRFYSSDGSFGLSHKIIRFTLYNNPYSMDPNDENSNPINFEGNYELGYFDSNDNFQPLDELDDYISFGQEVEGQILDENTLFLNLWGYMDGQKPQIFMTEDIHLLFAFRYVVNNQVVASKILPIENGVTLDMAKFNVTATSINASVRESKLIFTEEGLQIDNGDFKITKDGEQLFGFKTEQIGEQSVSKFIMKGTVYADDGEFKGIIRATDASFDSGTIGGFKIEKNKLVSSGTVSENNTDVPAIELNGINGKIVAHSIELGDNAIIKNQIKLGSAYLKNPDKNKGEFIRSGDILIKDDGTAKFGEISVDGSKSEISSNTWSIGKDYASFSNVNVSGSIETAVFKTNSVQAAGGAMIFRPSYKVSLIQEGGSYLVQFEDEYKGALGNTIQIVFNGTNQGYIGTVNEVEGNKMSVVWDEEYKPQQTLMSATLIDYGNKNYMNLAHDQVDVLIGVNSGNTGVGINSSILPRGITLTTSNTKYFDYIVSTDSEQIENKTYYKKQGDEYIVTEDFVVGEVYEQTIKYKKPKLYLGDLSQIKEDGDSIYSGYGLYADNVFLNGSLTTKVGQNSYAGVNTLNGVHATAFKEEFEKKETPEGIDESRIVFWAGADSVGDNDIARAYFQVTEAGSLYAQRAKLEDSLLVGGIIEAAEIHTAELHGREGALSIYDGTKGIQFKKGGNQNPEQVIFSINTSGLVADNKNFINIADKITILGDYIRTFNGDNYLSLETLEKDGGKVTPVLKHSEGENNCGFYFEKTQTAFKMNENSIQTWTVEETKIHNSLELNREGCSMQYKREDNGYNLYIVM